MDAIIIVVIIIHLFIFRQINDGYRVLLFSLGNSLWSTTQWQQLLASKLQTLTSLISVKGITWVKHSKFSAGFLNFYLSPDS